MPRRISFVSIQHNGLYFNPEASSKSKTLEDLLEQE
jgi:hypothetical protein